MVQNGDSGLMNRTVIGSCGQNDADKHRPYWRVLQARIGILFIKHACGLPPGGGYLNVSWEATEEASHGCIGLWSVMPPYDAEVSAYIARARIALARLNRAVNWSELGPDSERE